MSSDGEEPGSGKGSMGDPRRSTKKPRIPLAPDPEAYERWWAAYQAGVRSPGILARQARVSIHTIRHAIRHGWPAANLPALSARAELFDRQKGAAVKQAFKTKDEQTVTAIAQLVSGSWEDTARRILANMERATGALAALGEKISMAAAEANFVRYRDVPLVDDKGEPKIGKNGKAMTTLRAEIDGPAVAAALRLWMSASKDHAGVARAVFGAVDGDARKPGALVDLPPISQEQLEQIRSGELPRDLTDEQLATALIEATRVASGD